MQERNEARMAEIIASLQTSDLEEGSKEQKVRDLYASFLDEAAIEETGMAPFAADLSRLAAIKTHEDVALAMADPELGIGSIFGIGVNVDSKSPTEYAVYAGQSGLGLPDRSYYLREGEKLDTQRAAYESYMADVFRLVLPEKEPIGAMQRVHITRSALMSLRRQQRAFRGVSIWTRLV